MHGKKKRGKNSGEIEGFTWNNYCLLFLPADRKKWVITHLGEGRKKWPVREGSGPNGKEGMKKGLLTNDGS